MEYRTVVDIPQGDRGVIHPGHPPVIGAIAVAQGRKYVAGTLLKHAAGGAVPAADADQADIVLVQDVDTTGEVKTALCLLHGIAVSARLVNAAGADDEPASAALMKTLSAAGIYPLQGFDSSAMA